LPDRKVPPKKSHPQWPFKISGRPVKASPPLRPLEGGGPGPRRKPSTPAERYLPFDGPYWSPSQVLVWIMTRDPDTVEHMASHWPAKHEAGHERKLPTTFETALAEMAHAAETGRITASGYRWHGAKAASRQPISSSQWSHDAVLTADSILTPHPDLRTLSGRKVDWVMVWFDRASVLRTWPAFSMELDDPAWKTPSDTRFKEAIRAEYRKAEESGNKPPNIKEIVPPVQAALQAEGYKASGKRIQEFASDNEFKRKRLQPGKRYPRLK
jgi:hypothetical protein